MFGLERRDDRQTANQLRNDAEFQQIVGLDLLVDRGGIPLLPALDLGAKTDALLIQTLLDDLLDPVERTAADEENVLGIDLDELLMGMLAPSLGRNIGYRSLQDLEQRLLHSLARHIPGDGGVFALTGDLVDLIHIDDAALGQLDVKIGRLHQAQEDVLDIVAHIAGLCEGGRVRDGERHLQDAGQGLGKRVLPLPVGPIRRMLLF